MIGQIVPLTGAALQLTQSGAAMVASVKYFNDHGGLFGHPLKLDQCDSKDLASAEAQCAQQLVNDKAVAEIGGDLNFNTDAAQAALSAASIPRIGLLRGSVTEYAAKTNYDFTPGIILGVAALAVDVVRQGCKTVSMVTVDTPTASQLKALIAPIVTQAGGTFTNVVLVPGTATDYTQYIQAAQASNTCGTAVALGTAQANAFMQAFNQVKPNLKLSLPSATYASTDLAKLGAAAKAAGYTYGMPGADDPGVPGLKNAVNILVQGGSGLTAASTEGNALMAVLGMQAFMQAMNQYKGSLASTSSITGADVIAAMNAASNLNLWGIVPAWTPSKLVSAGPVFGPIFANISNPYEYDSHWNGHYSNSGTFNILADVPGSPAAAAQG